MAFRFLSCNEDLRDENESESDIDKCWDTAWFKLLSEMTNKNAPVTDKINSKKSMSFSLENGRSNVIILIKKSFLKKSLIKIIRRHWLL